MQPFPRSGQVNLISLRFCRHWVKDMSDWNPHQNVITTADNHKIVYKSNTSSSKWSILPQVFPRLHLPTAPHQLFLLLHMQCRSGAALLSILSQFSGSGGQKSQLAGRERWRHCVSRHCWVWNCELRTSVKIWESINGGEAKPYGLRPPTGPPPSPATLDKGQRWRKEPCALLALSQHKTVGFQIFRFDRRFVHFFVFALKCEGCSVGALWSSGLNDNLVSRAESSREQPRWRDWEDWLRNDDKKSSISVFKATQMTRRLSQV